MTARDTGREKSSGLPGLGGRPSLHPDWSEHERPTTQGQVDDASKKIAASGRAVGAEAKALSS